MLRLEGPEVALAGAEHHGHHGHRDLVDEPEREGLPADIAGDNRNIAVAREFPGDDDRATYVVDELAGRLGVPALRPPACATQQRCVRRPAECLPTRWSGRRGACP